MTSCCEYEIVIPRKFSENGHPKFHSYDAFLKRLLARFGGLTVMNIDGDGFWKAGAETSRDAILLWKVIDRHLDGLAFISEMKTEMEAEFQEDEILIIARKIDVL